MVRTERRYLTDSQDEVLVAEVRWLLGGLISGSSGRSWRGLRRELVDPVPGKLATDRVVSTVERARGRCRAAEHGKSTAARRTPKTPAFLNDVLAWHLGAFESDE